MKMIPKKIDDKFIKLRLYNYDAIIFFNIIK